MKHYFIPFSMVALLFILLSSCVKYGVSTNSFIDSEALPQGFPVNSSFAIVPTHQYNELFSKEVVGKVSKILEEKGYSISDIKKADYYLCFDFGMESSTATINTPKYIPGQTQTTSGNAYGNYGRYASYKSSTTTSGTTVYVPENYTFFTRNLKITVYDAKAYRKKKLENMVWYGASVSSGSNSDLRQVIDYLLVTTFDKFGISTGKAVYKEMSIEDRRVKWLRGEPVRESRDDRFKQWDEEGIDS